MMIIGVDYHPSFQAIAFLMEETGECGEQELNHSDGQAEKFYRDLKQRGIRSRVAVGISVARYPPHGSVRALTSAYGSYLGWLATKRSSG
jgi:hypothetical protein